jgi:hypothetical protein
MATTRERTYSICSVSQYKGKEVQAKNSRKERACRMRANDNLFFFFSLLLVMWFLLQTRLRLYLRCNKNRHDRRIIEEKRKKKGKKNKEIFMSAFKEFEQSILLFQGI